MTRVNDIAPLYHRCAVRPNFQISSSYKAFDETNLALGPEYFCYGSNKYFEVLEYWVKRTLGRYEEGGGKSYSGGNVRQATLRGPVRLKVPINVDKG